jgi:hypothetical protein
MTQPTLTGPGLVASLLAVAVREAEGQSGVLVRDVPHLEAAEVLPALAKLVDQGFDLRVAYLQQTAHAIADSAGLTDSVFSPEVEQAERWRNTRDLAALIVVVAEADTAKLTSLEDFAHIGPSTLRRLLVEQAVAEYAELNDVLPTWWEIVGRDDQISFSDLVDYYLALHAFDGSELRDEAAIQINRLGLLPDPAFFDQPGEAQLFKRLNDNRSLALRLANFSEEDRQRVDKALAGETQPTRRSTLRARLRDLQEYRRGGSLGLTADDARQLLNLRKSKPKPKPKPNPDDEDRPAPQPPTTLNGLAIENLLREADAEDEDTADEVLDAAVQGLNDQIRSIDDSTVRPEPVGVTLPSGMKVDTVVATDVLNMVSRLVGDGTYGGLVSAQGEDISAIVRGFQQTAEVVTTFDRARIVEFLDAFANSSTHAASLRRAFDAFDTARTALLPCLGELCAAPLLVATAPKTRAVVVPVIEAYQSMLSAATTAFPALHEEFGDDARAVLEHLMLIDTIFLDNRHSLIGMLTPVHPMLLWHYSEYGRVLSEQKAMLADRDRSLVRAEFENGSIPFFFSSIAVPRTLSESAPTSLPFSGRFGGLPLFGSRSDARDPSDGVQPLKRLVETFVTLHPAAAEGLRLALLEPPDTGVYLSMVCDLAEKNILRGAHVSALRRAREVGAELNLSGDEERRVQQRFGNHSERRFTFEAHRVGPEDMTHPESVASHIVVAFDQSERHTADAGAPAQRIQPLANRRRLVYRISTQSLDLEPALGGILADYSQMASLAVGTRVNSYSSVHQSEALAAKLRDAARSAPWYVVADGHVDRNLDLGSLRIFTDREGTRDIVAFTQSPAAFRRSLRDVVRQFNSSVSDDTLDQLLLDLSELLDQGLLSLRPGKSGDTVQSHVRGILGLMVSVRALRDATPDGHDRVILSLDSPQARRWLHLADDPRRADLLVIDASDDGFTVTVVEVKTRQDTTSEYSLANGKVSGSAVEQLLSTHGLLRQVFDPGYPELLVTPSRREILREHLYRELSKAGYDMHAKQRWAKRSNHLFDDDPDVQLRTALIEVHLGHATSSLMPTREAHAELDGELVPVMILDLNEDGVPALAAALTPPVTDEAAPDAEESGDSGGPSGGSPIQPTPPTPNGLGGAAEPEVSAEGLPGSSEQPTLSLTARPRVLIGQGSARAGLPREVWFDPQNPEQSLSNPHISISGETGSGKTQATKAILHDLLPQGLPALILDFKDDYSKADFAQPEGFTAHDASYGGLPFNPMVPRVDPQTGRVNPVAHVHELANMLQRIYSLGDQQTYALREAMKETYAIAGIGDRPFIPTAAQQYLPFEAVREVLVREKATTLLGRLSPIFDLGLFSAGDKTTSLDTLLSTPNIIRLSQLPGDQVKNAVAEFFLMALYGFLIRREHPHKLERLLVLDEAWRLVNSPFLVPLMREGRAFGLGVIVATQFPKDLPEEVGGSTGTRLFFNQTKADQVREVQRTLIGKTSGQEADHLGNLVRGLAPLECLVQNLHYRPFIRVRAVPYFIRVQEETD